jgi:hypothetical protein
MNMTVHQKRAIRSPCYEADETSNPEFGWREAFDPTVTYVLTMNIGLE